MKLIILLLLLSCHLISFSQDIPNGVNTIAVKGLKFIDVCNKSLDSGYTIEKKDNDLQTAQTDVRFYPKYWNASYVFYIRVKDSITYLSATFTAPPDSKILLNEPVINHLNKKGKVLSKSLDVYVFLLLNKFALSFHKEISYLKK